MRAQLFLSPSTPMVDSKAALGVSSIREPLMSHSPHEREEIIATIDRLEQVAQSSHAETSERQELLGLLSTLRREVDDHFEKEGLPDTFHSILQQAESVASKRLGNEASEKDDIDLDLSWKELQSSLAQGLESWEAKHPKLHATFLNLCSLLSKAGI